MGGAALERASKRLAKLCPNSLGGMKPPPHPPRWPPVKTTGGPEPMRSSELAPTRPVAVVYIVDVRLIFPREIQATGP